MDDPYVDPHTGVFINKLGIRDADELAAFEREMTAQRGAEGFPDVPMTSAGYRVLHRHLFQDVFDWAGRYRTVDIARNNDYFCKAIFVAAELDRRIVEIRSEQCLQGFSARQFASRAAEHLSELNAIHPFREGNGRTMRAFIIVFARQAGHKVDLQRIDPEKWNEASRISFRSGDTGLMGSIVERAIVAST